MRTTILDIEKRLFFLIDDEKKRTELFNMILRYGEEFKADSQEALKFTAVEEKDNRISYLRHLNMHQTEQMDRLNQKLEMANMKIDHIVSSFQSIFRDELED